MRQVKVRTNLNLLDACKILAETTQKLIASGSNIGLKTSLQLACYTTHYHRGELNYLLRMGILILVTGSLKVYDNKILKILKLELIWVTLREGIERCIRELAHCRRGIILAVISSHLGLLWHLLRVKKKMFDKETKSCG